jgi:uncharacterized protein (TIGR02231 family)
VADRSELAWESRVEEVTFFEDRAEVRRRAGGELPAGVSRLRLPGVALTTDDASLVVEASGAAARVISARMRRQVREVPAGSAGEIAQAEAAEREARTTRLAATQALSRAEAEEARLAALSGELVDGIERVPRGLADKAAAWQATHADLWAAGRAALDRLAEARAAVRAAERAEAVERARLAQARQLSPRYEAAVEVIVEAEAAGAVELRLTYRTPAALWRPEHAAVLAADGTLTWRTFAAVWQRTGEDWQAVRCRFSTARPARAAEPPLLSDEVLRLARKEERGVSVEAREETTEVAGLDRGVRRVEEMPGVDDGGEPLVFTAPHPVTLLPDGEAARVELLATTFAAAVETVAWPERSTAAHLRATATWPGPQPLLAGPVRLGRGASLVGRGSVGFVGAGEPFELGFGVDDRVRVRRKADEERETGLLGGQRIDRTVELYVSNLGDEERRLTVIERYPVSELPEVKVTLLAVDGARRGDKEGMARFTVAVAPRAHQTLTFKYRLEAPGKVRLRL